MAAMDCPIPQVGEALAPYIHSRHETQRIRRAIAEYLGQGLDHGPKDSLHLFSIAPFSSVNDDASSLEGIYKRYYDAMRAKIDAQDQYDRVKQELEDLKQTANARGWESTGQTSNPSAVQQRVQAKRQKQQQSKLGVIQNAVGRLVEEAPRPLHEDLGAVLREEVGDASEPPNSALGLSIDDSRLKALMFRLKREILLARDGIEQAARSNARLQEQVKAMPKPSEEAELYALRHARAQLIAWIEGELAKISEGEGDISTVDSELMADSAPPQATGSTEQPTPQQIQELYDKYVESRRRLVQNVNTALEATQQRPQAADAALKGISGASDKERAATDSITYTDLAAYAPNLVQAARLERALMQHSTYLHRQVNTASEQTQATIQRLAGESYLVAPDATDMGAWAAATVRKAAETDDFVAAQIKASTASLLAMDESLAQTRSRLKALAEMKGELLQ